jgi:hypothetical protein
MTANLLNPPELMFPEAELRAGAHIYAPSSKRTRLV